MWVTSEINWWILPLVVTVLGFIFALEMNRQDRNEYFGLKYFFAPINYLIFFITPASLAWMVWALFTF